MRGIGPGRWLRLLLMAAALAGALLLSGAWAPAAAGGPVGAGDEAAALEAGCRQAMVQGSCRVMSSAAQVDPATRVFIAGSGEVDAAVYAELRRQGDAMCGSVAVSCRQEPRGNACRIARSLYGGVPAAGR